MSGAEHQWCEHPVLRVSGVSVTYPPASTVLDQVSFELPEGGSLAIVGRTGSGNGGFDISQQASGKQG